MEVLRVSTALNCPLGVTQYTVGKRRYFRVKICILRFIKLEVFLNKARKRSSCLTVKTLHLLYTDQPNEAFQVIIPLLSELYQL
jgi:hypothetical protein